MFTNPILIEKISFPSLSAAIITSLLTGAGDARPENYMVKYVREKSAYGTASDVERVEILGVTSDAVYRNTAFSYTRIVEDYSTILPPSADQLLTLREQGIKDVGIGFNALYFLPQMDEPIAPEISTYFASSPTIAEEIVCQWLQQLYRQNKQYEGLRSSAGFVEADYTALKLPILIPLG